MPDNERLSSYTPMFTAHGEYARACHIGDENRTTLCGQHKQHPHLLWHCGIPIANLKQWIQSDADGSLCGRCKRIALLELNREPAPSTLCPTK